MIVEYTFFCFSPVLDVKSHLSYHTPFMKDFVSKNMCKFTSNTGDASVSVKLNFSRIILGKITQNKRILNAFYREVSKSKTRQLCTKISIGKTLKITLFGFFQHISYAATVWFFQLLCFCWKGFKAQIISIVMGNDARNISLNHANQSDLKGKTYRGFICNIFSNFCTYFFYDINWNNTFLYFLGIKCKISWHFQLFWKCYLKKLNVSKWCPHIARNVNVQTKDIKYHILSHFLKDAQLPSCLKNFVMYFASTIR